MRTKERHRLYLAVLFSLLAHLTAFVLLLPLLAAWQAIKALFKDENENLKVALLMAILLHLALILPLIHLMLTMQPDHMASDMVTVDLWGYDTKTDEVPEKTPEEELEAYDPKEEIPDGQVVRAPPSKDERPPPDDVRFLSERDARVEEETAARIRLPGVAKTAPSPELAGEGKDEETKPGGMRMEEAVVGPPPPPDLERSDKGSQPIPETTPPALEDIDLNPSKEAMASTLKGTGLDHLEGIIEG